MLPDMRIMPILRACCGLSAVPVLPAERIVPIVPLASIVPILTVKLVARARSLTARCSPHIQYYPQERIYYCI